MARHCEHCGTEVAVTATFCRSCGQALVPVDRDPNQLPARPPASPPARVPAQVPPSAPVQHGPPVFYKNPGVATLLSFFWAGAGQIYNGQIGKGVVFLIMYGFSLLLMFVLIGFITTPILWIIGMVDANSSAKAINDRLAREQGQHGAPHGTF